MTEFLEDNTTIQKLTDSSVLSKQDAKMIVLDTVKDMSAGLDFTTELAAVQQRMEHAADRDAATVIVDSPGDLTQAMSATELAGLTYAQRLLYDAKQRVADGDYVLALELLDELLASAFELDQADPVRQEAHYLRALCHSRRGELQDVLRAFRPLRGQRLDAELRAQVRELRDGVRGLLAPRVVIGFLLTFPRQPAQAETMLREAIELDPEYSTYSFVLAGALASKGELEKALRVADQGLENAVEDRERLAAMAQQIRRQLAHSMLAEAVEEYKGQSYRKAQREVAKLPRDLREIPEVEDFDHYLGELMRRGKKAHLLPPTGPFERVDALYFLLAGKEIAEARTLFERDEQLAAERVLARALTFVPRFPYANFLYALSLYSSVGRGLRDPARADPDRQLQDLASAASAAKIAATDPGIGQARELVAAIERLEKQAREARLVNKAIDEFRAIMESARGGVQGPEHVAELHRRLTGLRDSIPKLQQAVVSAPGRRAVEQLGETVSRNLVQLSEVSRHQECFWEYQKIIETFNRPIENEAQLQDLSNRLSNLRQKITETTSATKDRAARRSLDQLARAVDSQLEQLEKSRALTLAGGLVREFNAVMTSVEAGVGDEAQLLDVRERLVDVRNRAEQARSSIRDRTARRTLDQLTGVLEQRLKELDRITRWRGR